MKRTVAIALAIMMGFTIYCPISFANTDSDQQGDSQTGQQEEQITEPEEDIETEAEQATEQTKEQAEEQEEEALAEPLDSNSKLASYAGVSNPRISKGVTTWDCVWFGHYPQSSASSNDKIKWRVLSVEGSDALLIADKVLDERIPYNTSFNKVTWEQSTLRSWLNGYGASSNREGKNYSSNNFIDKAFTAREQGEILKKEIKNNDNSKYGTRGGNDTSDKLFVLSIDEARNTSYGFCSSNRSSEIKTRRAYNSTYAKSKVKGYLEETTYGSWWLRSSGEDSGWNGSLSDNRADCASYVSEDGYLDYCGYDVNSDELGVRPALYLDLTSSDWARAGTVTSGGTVKTLNPDFKSGNFSVEFNPVTKELSNSIPGYYSDNFFKRSNSSYDSELAKFSLLVSMASMSKVVKDRTQRNAFIKNILKEKLKYEKYTSYKYDVSLDDNTDTVGYSFARKKIDNQYVMVIAIRSGGYGNEWESNARVGGTAGSVHYGFGKAASAVLAKAKTYAKDNNIKKIWICGYSRGGAVSNILGKKILDAGLVSPSNLYCYTFEAPTTSPGKKSATGVYNIVSTSDIVPQVPLTDWGFDRYGKTLYLCSSRASNLSVFDSNLRKVKNTYNSLTGKNYKVANISMHYAGLSVLNQCVGGSRSSYANKYQNLTAKALKTLMGTEDKFVKSKDNNEIMGAANWLLAIAGIANANTAVMSALGIAGAAGDGLETINMQHFPEAVYSWLNNTDPVTSFSFKYIAVTLKKKNKTLLDASSSADDNYTLKAYDKNNVLVAEINDGQYSSFMEDTPELCLDTFIDDAGKIIMLVPADSDYSFQLEADSDIRADYCVSEYEDNGELNRVVNYNDILIPEGETLSSTSEEGTGISLQSYNPSLSEEEITNGQESTGEELRSSEIVTDTFGKGSITGGGLYPKDTDVILCAYPEEGATFVGWYENEELISEEDQIVIRTEEDNSRTIVGKFDTDIADCDVSAADKTYSGSDIVPDVTVGCGVKTLDEGTDYTMTSEGNLDVGVGNFELAGQGLFHGTTTGTFKINPKGTSIKSRKALKKGFKISWKKQSALMSTSRIDGYELRYSTKSSMSGAKTKVIKGYGSTSKKVTRLKGKKKYYIQVRTYKTVDDVNYYSSWSTKKYVKTK